MTRKSSAIAAKLLAGACVFAFSATATAAICNSLGSGNWSAVALWDCGAVPGAADDVFIQATHTVAIDTAAVAATVTVNAGGALQLLSAGNSLSTSGDVTLSGGSLLISAGAMYIGSSANNATIDIDTSILALDAGSTFQMNGGVLNIGGGVNDISGGAAVAFTMNGGTITVQMVDAGPMESFMLDTGSTFTMTGGLIVLVNGDNATWDMDLRSGTQNVTGGTVQIGSAATTAANSFAIANGGGGTFSLWNLTLASAPARTNFLGSPINILNDLTIQANNTFNDVLFGAFPITIGGGNSGGNWTNNGAFTQGTSTVTFTGTFATPALGGTSATTFNNLVINKAAGNLSIASGTPSPTVNATLTLTSGRIITAGGSCAAATPVIVANAGTIAGGSAASFVQGALRKNYAAGANLSFRGAGADEFPVGTSSGYSPIEINAGTTSTAGNIVVCVTATDDPNMTQALGGGIDTAKSVNRYWSMTTTTITLSALMDAIYKFNAGDVDVGASTGNFIVERWNGAIWSPTTLVTAAVTSTRVRNVNLTAGTNEFQIGEPLSGFNGYPGAFNAFESSTPANSILGRIYTKIVGTAITLDVVAVNANRNGVNTGFNTNPITVALLDARDNTGAVTLATDCRASWGTVLSTQSLSPVWASGRATVTITAPANAARDVRVRVTRGGNIGCSTDRFSIRPTAYSSITSNMNNSGTFGAPSLKTGQNFTVNALTGLSGYDNGSGATLANPQLIPLIDNTMVTGSPNAGTIAGVFGAAAAGTATGASFTYSEVGNFGLNNNLLTTATNAAIYDNVFTAVDQSSDCISGSFSNTLAGGRYGCNFGSAVIALGSGFGRFIPDHFFLVAGSTLTNRSAAGCAPTSSFSYLGEGMALAFTLQARNSSAVVTQNYAGAYAKLSPGTIAQLGFGAVNGATNLTSRLDLSAGSSSVSGFVSGQAAITATVGITRAVSPDGPFTTTKLGLAPSDSDGVTARTADMNMDVDGVGGNDHVQVGASTELRFGRLRIFGATGVLNLPLPLQIQTEYWTGTGFTLNSLDSCTTLARSDIALGAYTASVAAPLAACATFVGTTPVSISSGTGLITLAAPGSGSNGSVTLTPQLGSTFAGQYCTAQGPSSNQASTTAAAKSYLQGAWNGIATYDQNPSVRADFGVYGAQPRNFIFFRENY